MNYMMINESNMKYLEVLHRTGYVIQFKNKLDYSWLEYKPETKVIIIDEEDTFEDVYNVDLDWFDYRVVEPTAYDELSKKEFERMLKASGSDKIYSIKRNISYVVTAFNITDNKVILNNGAELTYDQLSKYYRFENGIRCGYPEY